MGSYATGVVATFNGDATHAKSTRKGALTVSRFATSLSGVSGSGVFGGSGSLDGHTHLGRCCAAGSGDQFSSSTARTSAAPPPTAKGSRRWRTSSLAGVNAGAYPNAVTASFVGSVTYAQNAFAGTLTVSQAHANVTLSGLTQTFNGLAQSVTVTTNPAGLAYTSRTPTPAASPSQAPRPRAPTR